MLLVETAGSAAALVEEAHYACYDFPLLGCCWCDTDTRLPEDEHAEAREVKMIHDNGRYMGLGHFCNTGDACGGAHETQR